MAFANHEFANQFLRREYRDGFRDIEYGKSLLLAASLGVE